MPANRSYTDLHYDQVLTNLSIAHFQSDNVYIATKVFPPVPVKKASNKYRTYPRGYFSRSDIDDSIAPETKANRVNYGTALESYSVDQKGLRTFISDEDRANVDQEQNLDFEATHMVTESLLVRREKKFADNFLKTGVWGADYSGSGASGTVLPTDQWNDNGGEPIIFMRELQRNMQEKTAGRRPNRILMSRDVYDALLDHNDVLDRIKGGATTDKPAMTMSRLLAGLFEVDQILVMQTVHNTASDAVVGEDDEPANNLSFVKKGVVLLYYHKPMTNAALYSATAGVTFVWSKFINPSAIGGSGAGPWMRRYRESPAILGEYIEGRYASSPKVISADCGTFLENMVA